LGAPLAATISLTPGAREPAAAHQADRRVEHAGLGGGRLWASSSLQ
jgi:hypothetical protein